MNDIKFENDEMSLEERVADLEKAVKEQCETIKNLMDIVKILSGIEED